MKIFYRAFFALILLSPAICLAQGCSLCRDTTAGSAPHARKGLQRAILVLGIPAGAVFVGVLIVASRIGTREE